MEPGKRRSSKSSRKQPPKTLSQAQEQATAIQSLILNAPKTWAKLIYGVNLWGDPLDNKSQASIVYSVLHHRRTTAKGCVASGKTAGAGLAVHAFLQAFPYSKVLATAPSHRQVEKALWAEVRTNYFRAKNRGINLGGEMKPAATEWIIEREGDQEWYALGFATDDPNRIHGFHGQKILVIVDEAQGMDIKALEAIENVMSDGNAHLLLLQNPSALTGESYDSFHKKGSLYNKITISAYDTPNFTHGKGTIRGLADPDQIAEWLKVYGPDSNFCRIKVFAKFPRQESDTLIPLDWIEAAHKRKPKTSKNPRDRGVSVDVARYGDDSSSIQPFSGRHLFVPKSQQGWSTTETAGRTRIELTALQARLALVDGIGIGAGVVDSLRDGKEGKRLTVIGVNVGALARNPKKFANLRSELNWNMRESLNPANPNVISMDEYPKRTEDLASIKYRVNERGQIVIEPKDKQKNRTGRSPDDGDSAVMAVEGMRYAGKDEDFTNANERPTSGLEHDVDTYMGGYESESVTAGFEE